MKFHSPTDEPVHIALTSGHTAVVGPQDTELDKIFHKEAIARGCLPEGTVSEEAPKNTGFDRKKVLTDAMNAMLEGADEGDFKADGTPNLNKLSERVGFKVSREEADAAWAEVSKEA